MSTLWFVLVSVSSLAICGLAFWAGIERGHARTYRKALESKGERKRPELGDASRKSRLRWTIRRLDK